MSTSNIPQQLRDTSDRGIVPVEYLTGQAGTGKTFELLRRIGEDPEYGKLCATTGIAAMNLGTITLNSLLKYFDTESLEEAFFNGFLLRALQGIADDGFKWLIIDEISMMDARQLDLIYQATKQMNEQRLLTGEPPLGLILTGDFCQLPPIKAKWAFEAQCWPEFSNNVTRLTKVWRQSDATFLEAINLIRNGNGPAGASMLGQMGIEFIRSADTMFDGTTIMAKNKSVDNFNWLSHSRLVGIPVTVSATRWGEQRNEWKHIPDQLQLKIGAYVMILSNDVPDFTYVNGDCGHVVDHAGNGFQIELVRNKAIVNIGPIMRTVSQKHPPDLILLHNQGLNEAELRRKYNFAEACKVGNSPYWDADRRRWITGAVIYHPLRLAYASTVHKSQGLTLDRIQVDINDHFFGQPAMAYVALSRCRTPGGLRIVGTPQLLAARVKCSPEVLQWL